MSCLQENGGVWQGSLNQPWVWALASINSTDAWEQFLLNTLTAEAVAYGDAYWAGNAFFSCFHPEFLYVFDK